MKKQTTITHQQDDQKKIEESVDELFVAEELTEEEQQLVSEKLDPVGSEDSDVDNDGDSDKSDEYLKNRREVIAKAIKESAKKKSMKMEGEDEEEEEEEEEEELEEAYAIMYKGKVFDSYDSEEEAKDALDGMKLSSSERSQYSIKKTSQKSKQWSMKEETISEAQSAALKEIIKKINAASEKPDGHAKEAELNKLAAEFAKAVATEKGQKLPTREDNQKVDMSEDISALVEGESELSEDFKLKAQTIFESAVNAKIKEITEELVVESDAKIKEITKEILRESEKELEESVDFIIDQVNRYLDHVVEEWMEENTLAVESGLRTEIAEEFIGNLKNLFQEHYIEVPESKTDLVQELAEQVETLKAQINEVTEQNLELHQKQKGFAKKAIIEESCSDLSLTQQEKLKALVEDVEFTDEDQFIKKVNILKKSYFSTKSGSATLTEEIDSSTLGENVDTSLDERKRPTKMDMYVRALESGVMPGSNLFGGK